MSGSIGAVSSGALGTLIADSHLVRAKLDTLTQQAGDGFVAPTLGGMGGAAATITSLAPAIGRAKAVSDGIDASTGRMTVAQTALTSLSAIASSFYAQIDTLNGLNASDVDSVAAGARAALAQAAGLLDTKNGDTYVFAGTASDQAPIANPDQIASSGFATQIAAIVAGLGANGAATAAAARAVAASNTPGTSPFNPSATAASRSTVVTGDGGQTVPTGILASGNADVPSLGAATTGSYSRDILAALATLGGLSSGQLGAGGFGALVNSVRTSLGGAITALNADAGVMGDRQTALVARKTELAATDTALKSQLGSARDVDMAATLTQLTQTQTQLSASYQLIASVQNLSLTKYLTAGG